MIEKRFRQLGVIPVVTIQNAADADPLGDALIEGGLPCAEITIRTDAALAAIQILAKRSDLLVGAGTVLSVDNAAAAKDAGAAFLVSPGFNPKVVGWALENHIPIFPGVATATEIEMALDFELKYLKFFPAEPSGGIKTIDALSKPYHMVNFIPTGGVSLNNLEQYLSKPYILACGGSWMVKSDWIQEKDFANVLEETKKTVQQIKQIRRESGIIS